MGLVGDISQLARAAATIRATSEISRRAPSRIAASVLPLIASEFDAGTDPSGSPWAALAPATIKRGRGAPPLTATGRMRSSVQAKAEAAGVAFVVAPPSQFHETGTRKMPARPILPSSASSTPEAWTSAVKVAVEAELRALGAR